MTSTIAATPVPIRKLLRNQRAELAYFLFGPKTIALSRDFLFSVTTASILWDIRSPVGRLPIFLVFATISAIASIPYLINFKISFRVFVLPLFVFLVIHLTFAFRVSHINGIKLFLQFFVVSIFLWSFSSRYSQVSMKNYMKITGAFLFLTLLFVLGYNIIHHKIFSWKLLSRGKSIFDLLPLMLIIMARSDSKLSKILLPFFTPFFLALILISGERKAYILILLLLPLLINFRNPIVYVIPLIAGAMLPLAITLDKGGYVSRQINTLIGFGHGKVVHTLSNDERFFGVQTALHLFKEHPVFGVGTNGYNDYVQRVYFLGLGTHNEWLRVSAENGVFGLFFYALVVVYGFVRVFRKKSGDYIRSGNDKVIGYALFVTCLLYLSFEAFDYEVLLAFCVIPLIQFLRFKPDLETAQRPAEAQRRQVRSRLSGTLSASRM